MNMNTSAVHKISSHPRWVATMYEFVAPHWDNLVNGQWAESIASTRLSVEEMQGWILQIYPFIYDFPKFLAEALIKVEDDFSRTFLIENIRIEKAHAEHWLWMFSIRNVREKSSSTLIKVEDDFSRTFLIENIHSQCSACAFSIRMFSIRKVREKS